MAAPAAISQAQIILRSATEGGLNGPPFLFLDTPEPRHSSLEARLVVIITPRLEAMGYELVRVAVLGRDRLTIQVMADHADGGQITIAECEAISHALGAVLDVEDPIPGAWSLEISSPGIDRPLTRVKDWNRFAGHLVRAETVTPVAGRKRFSGIALGADERSARLRLPDGSEITLALDAIRRAKLVLTDALIEATAIPPRTN